MCSLRLIINLTVALYRDRGDGSGKLLDKPTITEAFVNPLIRALESVERAIIDLDADADSQICQGKLCFLKPGSSVPSTLYSPDSPAARQYVAGRYPGAVIIGENNAAS